MPGTGLSIFKKAGQCCPNMCLSGEEERVYTRDHLNDYTELLVTFWTGYWYLWQPVPFGWQVLPSHIHFGQLWLFLHLRSGSIVTSTGKPSQTPTHPPSTLTSWRVDHTNHLAYWTLSTSHLVLQWCAFPSVAMTRLVSFRTASLSDSLLHLSYGLLQGKHSVRCWIIKWVMDCRTSFIIYFYISPSPGNLMVTMRGRVYCLHNFRFTDKKTEVQSSTEVSLSHTENKLQNQEWNPGLLTPGQVLFPPIAF